MGREVRTRITTQRRRIQQARRRARQYVKPGTSLVNELLDERRAGSQVYTADKTWKGFLS